MRFSRFRVPMFDVEVPPEYVGTYTVWSSLLPQPNSFYRVHR